MYDKLVHKFEANDGQIVKCILYTKCINDLFLLQGYGIGLWCSTPLLTIFQLSRGGQF